MVVEMLICGRDDRSAGGCGSNDSQGDGGGGSVAVVVGPHAHMVRNVFSRSFLHAVLW